MHTHTESHVYNSERTEPSITAANECAFFKNQIFIIYGRYTRSHWLAIVSHRFWWCFTVVLSTREGCKVISLLLKLTEKRIPMYMVNGIHGNGNFDGRMVGAEWGVVRGWEGERVRIPVTVTIMAEICSVRMTSFSLFCLSLHWQRQWQRCVGIVFGIPFFQRIEYPSKSREKCWTASSSFFITTRTPCSSYPIPFFFLKYKFCDYQKTKIQAFSFFSFSISYSRLWLFYFFFFNFSLFIAFVGLAAHSFALKIASRALSAILFGNLILWNFILLTTDDISMRPHTRRKCISFRASD